MTDDRYRELELYRSCLLDVAKAITGPIKKVGIESINNQNSGMTLEQYAAEGGHSVTLTQIELPPEASTRSSKAIGISIDTPAGDSVLRGYILSDSTGLHTAHQSRNSQVDANGGDISTTEITEGVGAINHFGAASTDPQPSDMHKRFHSEVKGCIPST